MNPRPSEEPEDTSRLLPDASGEAPPEAPAERNRVNVVLLVATALLYGAAVGGAMEILDVFVLKEPLSWSATEVIV